LLKFSSFAFRYKTFNFSNEEIRMSEKRAGDSPEQVTSHSVMVARLAWAMFGPGLFLLSLVPLARAGMKLSAWDFVFLTSVGMMLWGRWAEQKSGNGTTLYGDPSTWAHFRRYSLILVAIAVISLAATKVAFS
jgi:hypothetical protein